jgi:fatty acid desaturase
MSIKRFYQDRFYHIRSFALHLAVAACVCALLYSLRDADFYRFDFAWWQPLVYLPLGIYFGGLSAVFIHNATHNSFPNRFLNELGGQIAGVHQLWGFLGWKIIHLIHHNYSDKGEMDPHPPKGLSFGRFLAIMFLRSSRTVTQRYREHWGSGFITQALHLGVLVTFLGMSIAYLAFWFLLLGPEAFVLGYIPSLAFNHWFFAHINYYCHPLDDATDETAAANLNHNWYYHLANRLWFGIYYHGNHHRKPNLFNPSKLVLEPERNEEREKAKRYA